MTSTRALPTGLGALASRGRHGRRVAVCLHRTAVATARHHCRADRADGTGVWDATPVHDIAVEVDDAAFAAMIDTYQDTGEKEWIEATVTIDGETFDAWACGSRATPRCAG